MVSKTFEVFPKQNSIVCCYFGALRDLTRKGQLKKIKQAEAEEGVFLDLTEAYLRTVLKLSIIHVR